MKNKIVGIVIFMLVATTVVSATNINVKEKIQPTLVGVDVPVWEKGDSWTYEYHHSAFNYNTNGTSSMVFYLNCTITFIVTDTTGENYTVKTTTKNTEGRMIIGLFKVKLTRFTKLSEEYKVRKTDLANVQDTYQIKGPVIWFRGKIGLPIPAQYHITGEEILTPPMTLMPFPLIAGTNGTLPQIHHIGYEKLSMYWGLISIYDYPEVSWYTGPCTYTCKMENITIPKGTYEAYNVSAIHNFGGAGHDYWHSYYVPEIGNFVKYSFNIDWDSTGKPYAIRNLELVSTTYTP
jgi:ribosomal protein L33